MSHVSDRAKCSKGTLYSYFASKEELFCEVVIDGTTQESQTLFIELETSDETAEKVLHQFGIGFLKTLYAPKFQALRRLVFSAAFDKSLGRAVYEKGVKPYEIQAANLLLTLMEKGQLRRTAPDIAAHHLCGLLESETLLKFLLGALDAPRPKKLEEIANRAVAVFCAAYVLDPS